MKNINLLAEEAKIINKFEEDNKEQENNKK